ncbi:hypothetical protein H7X46_28035 [Pseudonocardia sp. C8]|uniref:hypothetical protein n=1 Tax=Pseudonocardia sp. C8 TaxID=2762759 RepID=UPI001642F58E|nr:hypothetical protein [Pseudonocardia sp. C8]MBC3194908.1 hypothetical protein [Pseudonocardia sp. C8]
MEGTVEDLFELRALVACHDVLLSIACRAARVAALRDDLYVLPLPKMLDAGVLGVQGVPVPPETGFRWMTPAIYEVIGHASFVGPVGYLEIHCTVTSARQAAAVWVNGSAAYGPDYLLPSRAHPVREPTPVGEALSRLGLLTDGLSEELAVSGLDRCRSTDDWFAMADQVVRQRT